MTDCAADNCISVRDADRLLSAHDGDMALLFLWMRRHASSDLERAARDLCRTRGEMDAALEKLRRMGLAEGEETPAPPPPAAPAAEKLPPPEELPEYTVQDITARNDAAFKAVVTEAQQVLGHVLSTPDLKKLFGIYDYLGLPGEVILQLLHYCVQEARGRRPSMRYIEKEAFDWAKLEILTLEQAESFIASDARRREESAAVAESLGIRGRELSATEEKYIRAWIAEGTPRELIALAYDRTVTNTGGLRWSYLNKILLNWKEKGIRSAAEVKEKDLPPRRRETPARQPDKPVGLGDVRSMMKNR